MSKREANKIANRQAIIDAARTVFCTLGYEAAGISDVVKMSGLSVGTFYNYFGNKKSLMTILIEDLLKKIRIEVHQARVDASSPEHFVRGAFFAFIRVLKSNPDNLALLRKNSQVFRSHVFSGAQIDNIFTELEKDMQSAIENRLLPPFPVSMMTACMVGATIEVFTTQVDIDADETADFLSTLFLGGIQNFANNKAGGSPVV